MADLKETGESGILDASVASKAPARVPRVFREQKRPKLKNAAGLEDHLCAVSGNYDHCSGDERNTARILIAKGSGYVQSTTYHLHQHRHGPARELPDAELDALLEDAPVRKLPQNAESVPAEPLSVPSEETPEDAILIDSEKEPRETSLKPLDTPPDT